MGDYWVKVEHEGVVLDEEIYEAVLFRIAGEEVWFPRSQLDNYDDETMIVSRWLAKNRGLDYEEQKRTRDVCWKR